MKEKMMREERDQLQHQLSQNNDVVINFQPNFSSGFSPTTFYDGESRYFNSSNYSSGESYNGNNYGQSGGSSGIRQRPISSLIPTNNPVIQKLGPARVVKAANMVDQLTSLIGLFLRKYPVLRIFAIVYFVMIHVFILYLLTSWSSYISLENSSTQNVKAAVELNNRVIEKDSKNDNHGDSINKNNDDNKPRDTESKVNDSNNNSNNNINKNDSNSNDKPIKR